MGLLSGTLMSDKKKKKLADAYAMYQEAVAANPGAVPEEREYSPAELETIAADAKVEQQAMKDLHKRGVQAPAVIHQIHATDVADLGGGRKIEFLVEMQPAAGEPHWTKIEQHIATAQMQRLSEGQSVTVRYDPQAPDNAALVDW